MALLEMYIVEGERKEQFIDGIYEFFKEEMTKEELIEAFNSPKVIVHTVKRKTINNEQ